jgi:predicted DNA-binding antitoxin AbrB/MazE fold protein
MKETIDAIYENGVLRPLSRLHILDGRRIRVTVEAEYEEEQTSDPGAKPPFAVVRRALSRCLGSMADDVAAEREDRA